MSRRRVMRFTVLAVILVPLGACGREASPLINRSSTTASASSSASSSGTTTGGTSTAGTTTTAGTSSGNGTSSSGSGSSSSSTTGCAVAATTTGGTTTRGAPVACDSASVWVGDVCSLQSCNNAPAGSPCVLDGGGLGGCYGGNCLFFDLKNDPDNCGYYGVVCPRPARCENARCVGFDCADGGGCTSDRTCTSGVCVLVNCSQAPDDSTCVWSSTYANLSFPGVCCGGTCLDPAALNESDPMNCGGCGAQCPDGSICLPGGCYPAVACDGNRGGDVCALPSGGAGTCCGGGCTDLTTDPLNCFNCGLACPTGSSCLGAQCLSSCIVNGDCPAGYGCLDGGLCVLNACGPSDDYAACHDFDAGASGSLERCCGGSCVGLDDAQNCGRCGRACAAGEQCYALNGGAYGYEYLNFCAQSECTTDSLANGGDENHPSCFLQNGTSGTCCSGQCVDIWGTDPANCFACGLVCPTGSQCAGPTDSSAYLCVTDGGDRVGCAGDSDCPAGDKCDLQGACVTASCTGSGSTCYLLPDSGAGSGGWLSVYGYCCGGICTNVLADSNNCGACGVNCPLGATCALGSCFLPDAASPVWDCSVVSCALGSVCYRGACYPDTCGGGTDGNPCLFRPVAARWASDGIGTCCAGACVDTSSDPQNCNSCGFACSGGPCVSGHCVEPPSQNCLVTCPTGTLCAGTECVGSSCTTNSKLYDPVVIETPYCVAADGMLGTCCPPACAHLDRDPQNCGTCGIVCPPGVNCENGFCNGLSACGPGHAGSICNPDGGTLFRCCPGLGCIDTAADPTNCGDCGKTCTACETCVNGACLANPL
jgi:hypothetical protein